MSEELPEQRRLAAVASLSRAEAALAEAQRVTGQYVEGAKREELEQLFSRLEDWVLKTRRDLGVSKAL